MEALTSRSNKVLQLLQVHSRSFSANSLLMLPQHEQSFDDGSNLPITDNESWKTFYVPKLIELGAIPKDKLIDGKTYIGDTRNTDRAIWNAKKNTFIYMRTKWGNTFEDEVNHFEDDDHYALFVPIKQLD